MKRIEKVLIEVKKIFPEGIEAAIIAEKLNLARTNVSSDLNKLVLEEKIYKESSKRPVKYYYIDNQDIYNDNDYKQLKESQLDIFAKQNQSMFNVIELIKAAVLYPPNGMNILILGETGVGKSMLANLIYIYAVEINKLKKNSPFIVFNCADYANNQQLLISQIFGVKKGAYTGAIEDKIGLIEKANNGIIFFDEIHRLSPEGQEMLFTFMDKGVFRRLGETECRFAKAMIITATTENPDSSLLKTFLRRIPMIITIPNLKDRTLDERFNLICFFLKNEATKLNKPIKVSINAIRSFLGYNCPNNVGQLKSDIKLACAKAYANYVSGKKNDIEISSLDLPSYILNGLYKEIDHRAIWNKLVKINKRLCIFDPIDENKIIEEEISNIDIYELIDHRLDELKNNNDSFIYEKLTNDVNSFFSDYFEKMKVKTKTIENIIGEKLLALVSEIIEFSQLKLNKKFSEKVNFAIAMHIANLIERLNCNKEIYNKNLKLIKNNHLLEFQTAINCLEIIEKYIDKTIPIDEAGFLCIFFLMDEKQEVVSKYMVQILVIAHGKSTASSMVNAANELLEVNYAYGINANLDESPEKVLAKVKEYLHSLEKPKDILLLVDMGSLINFAEEIESEFLINVKTIPLVSTLHVLEATRKALMFKNLEEIYQETLNVNDYTNAIIGTNTFLENKLLTKNINKIKIISVCSSGEGTAVVVKKYLESKLIFDKNKFEIMTLNYDSDSQILFEIKKINKNGKILCIISNFNIKHSAPIFELNDIFLGKAVEEIQNLINIEIPFLDLEKILKKYLLNLDIKQVIIDIEEFIKKISDDLNKNIDKSRKLGIMLHMITMIDKIISGESLNKFKNMEEYIKNNNTLFNTLKYYCNTLNKKYNIIISDENICYLIKLFK